jgi:hypothetical protein
MSTVAKPSWELDGPYGPEQWFGQPGGYEQVLLAGEPVSLDPKDGELPLLRARGADCPHPGPWPFGFEFCPKCGVALQPAPPAPQAETWSSPANGASGLPLPVSAGTPDPSQRADFPMPGPSRMDFFVAGTPPRLLAFDQTTGQLHVWSDGMPDAFEDGRWRKPIQLPAAVSLPRWSWGVGAFAGGFAMPGDNGPLWVALLPQLGRPIAAKPALGVQRSLGGVAALGDAALVPVLANDGLSVAFWQSPGQGWQCTAMAGGADAAAQTFAAPSTNATEAFWVGQHGQLFARLDEGVVTCSYRPWRDDWRPLQGVRPVLSPNGVFHQLGWQNGQAFETLVPPGATPQRRRFEGYVTSCGSATFGGTVRFREPWEPARFEYRKDGTSFLLPLLAFGDERFLVASCSPRANLHGFISTDEVPALTTECRIMAAGRSPVPAPLGMTVKVSSAWEIVPFLYRGNLFVHDLRANKCVRWPLAHA